MIISEVFGIAMPDALPAGRATLLDALQAGIAAQLALLGDPGLTDTGRSSADVLGISVTVLAEKLTSHIVREIVVRGAGGGPLQPLAAQLNHDVTHLQGQRLEAMFGQLASEIEEALGPVGQNVSRRRARLSDREISWMAGGRAAVLGPDRFGCSSPTSLPILAGRTGWRGSWTRLDTRSISMPGIGPPGTVRRYR